MILPSRKLGSFLEGAGGRRLLILSRYPRQVVGWLLLILGFSYSANEIGYLFQVLGDAGLLNLPEPLLPALLGVGSWLFIFQPIIQQIFIPLYFPDGRLLTRRWRIVALAGGLVALLSFLSFAIYPGLTSAPAAAGDAAPAMSLASFLYFGVVQPLGFLTLGAVVLSVILRYRRSGPTQRAQMKWVLYVLVLSIAVQNLLWAYNTFTGRTTDGTRTLIHVVTLLFAIALPVAIGIAIARFRLYDIDLIIRRTLIYGTLTGALALVYLGSVILLQSLLGLVVASDSPLVLVASTLLIAALFNPLRRRIQDVIDRRFYRRKYDARATVREFAATLQAETDLQRMVDQLLDVAEETMQPESVAVWLVEDVGVPSTFQEAQKLPGR